MRFCLMKGGGSMAQAIGYVAASSLLVFPPKQGTHTLIGRGRGRSGASSSGGQQNRIYAMSSQHDLGSTPEVVTSILSIFSTNVYSLIDLDSIFSYITPFIVGKYGKKPELLH